MRKIVIAWVVSVAWMGCASVQTKTSSPGLRVPASYTGGCQEDSFRLGGRDPYGSTALESAEKEFLPRLSEFLADCTVQAKVAKVANGNSIEVGAYRIDGLMSELHFSVQDFVKHEKITCSMRAGYEMIRPASVGPGPIAAVAHMQKVITEPECTAPVRS